jgi:Transposase DDE domain group 1
VKRNAIPNLVVDPAREALVSSAGAVLLREVVRVCGVTRSLSRALAPWRSARAEHDPGKIVTDLAVAVALGGDCVADLAVVRAQPGLFGRVASESTVSRLVATLAGDIDAALPALRAARALARARAWDRCRPLDGQAGSRDGGQVIVDLDVTLVRAHSDKEGAEPTYKRGFGFAPMCAFVDHGEHGSGETLVVELRNGRASAFDTATHLSALDASLAQLPASERGQVLVRTDSAGASKAFLHRIADLGLEYSVGFTAAETVKTAIDALPPQAWQAARDGDGHDRDGAQVAELTRWLPDTFTTGPTSWPAGIRIIARRERPHPGAPLRLTDDDGWRITCFATNTCGTGWTLPVLEVRHRQRARAEDRIRGLKDTGLTNLPYHRFAANQIWLEIVALAADLLAWAQTLALPPTAPARRWEPKRLRLRLLAVAGRIVRSGRRHRLRLPIDWPWAHLITAGWNRLHDS